MKESEFCKEFLRTMLNKIEKYLSKIIVSKMEPVVEYSYTAHSWYSYPKVIPSNVTILNIIFVGIDKIPENLKYATNLKTLVLSRNNIKVLENLPPNIEVLICNMNKIEKIVELPKSLLSFTCNYNKLTSLTNLPPKLMYLDCADNKIEKIEKLPDSLFYLDCSANNLKKLPRLPKGLIKLYTQYNYLECLPTLPEGLQILSYHDNNNISEIDYLPKSLTNLYNETPYIFMFDFVESVRKKLEKQRYKHRIDTIKEELMMKAWHPDRIEKWLEMGYDMD